ncbi:MAG TPA: sensor histidine kinase [Anaeromyxobacter sp.]|nr:sensor histidine kinase [Anaeromyxobacter sp.]
MEPDLSSPFLPADRTDPVGLADEVARAAASPLIAALLEAAGTAAVVLDPNRQGIACNPSYLAAAGLRDPGEALGMRPGEALGCVHVVGVATGCGTTAACPTCGAALAMRAARRSGRSAERRCALAFRRGEVREEREFRARATLLPIDGAPFLLLTLEDVSAEARRAMVERSFLHDLSNLVVALQSVAEEMPPLGEAAAEELRQLAEQMAQQVRLQRYLAGGDAQDLEPLAWRPVEISDALELLRRALEREPAARGRAVEWPRVVTGLLVPADPAVLHHVLRAMAVNALEAVPPGERIRVEVHCDLQKASVRIWNPGAIPAEVAPRVFQRYFSTKPEAGRGHGTWSMRALGEGVLGGSVSFATSEADGTSFQVTLPRERTGDRRRA